MPFSNLYLGKYRLFNQDEIDYYDQLGKEWKKTLTYVPDSQLLIIFPQAKKLVKELYKKTKDAEYGRMLFAIKKKKAHTVDLEKIKLIPITEYLSFNQAGFSKCLWHDEKTASLKYYPKNNRIYCFGCSKGGSVIDVVMQIRNLTFKEAIRIL